jgi:hypothetical protein
MTDSFKHNRPREVRSHSSACQNDILDKGIFALSQQIEQDRTSLNKGSRFGFRATIAQYRLAFLIVGLTFFLSLISVFMPRAENILDKILPTTTFVLGYFFRSE